MHQIETTWKYIIIYIQNLYKNMIPDLLIEYMYSIMT